MTVTYPEGFSNYYTSTGAEILTPKKGNTPLFTVIFSIVRYVSNFRI